MMAGDSENIWEMDMNETETEDSTISAAEVEVVQSEEAVPKTVTTDTKEEKVEEAVVRRNKKGHIIL